MDYTIMDHTPSCPRRRALAVAMLLLSGLTLATPARAQVCSGDVTLGSQTDVNNFTCSEVTGDLRIGGADIDNLSPLSVLTSVGGYFFITHNPALASLAGLDNLTSVGVVNHFGALIIENNAVLTSLAGLDNLTFVSSALDISDNATLASLAALGNVTYAGLLIIENNAVLTSLAGLENLASAGHIYIRGNAALTSLAALSGVTTVRNTLYILDNDLLTSLAGLEHLTSVGGDPVVGGDIDIQDNAVLASLAALGNVTSVGGSLIVRNNAVLESLVGLENVTSVEGISIGGNAMLTSLAALGNVTSLPGGLLIDNNAVLASLHGLEHVTSVGGISIRDNALLASLAALSGVTSFPRGLVIQNNGSLTSLDGLGNVTSVGETLSIDNNDALTSLLGLSGLTSIGGSVFGGTLSIANNDALTSLDGLSGLTSIPSGFFEGAYLEIQYNVSLSECSCGLAGLISGEPPSFSGVEGVVTIANNDPGGTCTSPTVVLATECVMNQPPEITGVTVPADPVAVDVEAAVSASFTDPDADDAHTCTVDYGDGTPLADGTVSGLTCTGTHAYSAAGVYTVSVTVTDAAGESGMKAATDYVVVYDPSAGFVTGNGWINSPEGAYPADPTLSGLARFGFVSKYQRGANVPDGKTQFKFNAAGFTFKSTAYEWLVIAGQHAKFKGTGTIDGTGDYGFMLTATDGDPDLFRIKIWDADDVVVYDNQMGDVDDSNAGTALGGGQIIIHSTGGTSASKASEAAVPGAFVLSAGYPNPFAVSATVGFEVPETAHVRLVVYDVLGREVAVLADGAFEAARHQAVLDGRGLPSGIYLVRMTTDGGFAQTQRVTLIR